MKDTAPDIDVAADFLKEAESSAWERIGEGLMAPRPAILIDDANTLDQALQWLNGHTPESPRSLVEAALTNLRRIVMDLSFVLHHRMVTSNNHFLVEDWYRLYYGRPGHVTELENYRIHVMLIHNLAVELNRGLNLLLERLRDSGFDPPEFPLSLLIDIGSASNPYVPAAYSTEEKRQPEPYPGLESYPTAVSGREVGDFGDLDAACVDRWVDALKKNSGQRFTVPDDVGKVPLTRGRSKSRLGFSARPHPLTGVLAVLGAILTIWGIASSAPFVWGAALVATVSFLLCHWILKDWPPKVSVIVLLVVISLLGGFAFNQAFSQDSVSSPTVDHELKSPIGEPDQKIKSAGASETSVDATDGVEGRDSKPQTSKESQKPR